MREYLIPQQCVDDEVLDASGAERLERLYAAYADPLREYCLRRLGSPTDADDALHETMLRAHEALSRLPRDARLWSWLATIAANVCIDMQRRADRRYVHEQAPEPADVDVEEEVARRTRERILTEAIAELPGSLRGPLILRELMGWNHDEIATFYGRSIPWVKTTLMRTRRALPARVRSVARRRRNWPLPVAAAGRWQRPDAFLRPSRSRHGSRTQLFAWGQRTDIGGWIASSGQLAASFVAALATLCTSMTPSASMPADVASPTAVAPAAIAPAAAAVRREPAPAAASQSHGKSDAPVPTSSADDRTPGTSSRVVRVVEDLVAPEQPEDAFITDITPSPDYERDGTVYAAASGPCAVGCRVLFKSTDRGATWTRLPGVGLNAAHVVLPPAYPADDRIFAGGGPGLSFLQVSHDGGVTFESLGPAVAKPALSPAFSSGDPRVFLADSPPRQYDARTKAITPLLLTRPAGLASTSQTVALSPQFLTDETLWLGGVGDVGAESVGYVCRRGACTESTLPDGGLGGPTFVVGTGSAHGTLFAWTWKWLARSTDGGHTFSRVPARDHAGLQAVAGDDSGTLYAVFRGGDDTTGRDWTELHRSRDRGDTWEVVGRQVGLRRMLLSLTVLPDGRLLGGGIQGMLCSTDGGATWAPRCRG